MQIVLLSYRNGYTVPNQASALSLSLHYQESAMTTERRRQNILLVSEGNEKVFIAKNIPWTGQSRHTDHSATEGVNVNFHSEQDFFNQLDPTKTVQLTKPVMKVERKDEQIWSHWTDPNK